MLNIRIVLVNPTHPGNVGAAARAMKTMGLSQLYLVQPKLFPHAEATARASGADDVLAAAQIVDSLEEATADCQHIFATSARQRHLQWPTYKPRAAAEYIFQHYQQGNIAIVFGRESSGLTNDELSLCHAQIYIPTVAHFSSLNLAASVQILAYELYGVLSNSSDSPFEIEISDVASADDLNGFFKQLQQVMIDVNFLHPRQPRRLMHRLRRLFQRVQMSKSEINILRGFLSAVTKKVS